jgi:hypothetical protein
VAEEVDNVAVPNECGRESRLSELGGNAGRKGEIVR